MLIANEQDVEVDEATLVRLARHVLAQQRVPDDMEVSVLLVDEATMAELNEAHLGQPGPTDVLAFPIDEPGEAVAGGPAVLGDVVLCPAYVEVQAAEHGKSLADELAMLTVHGLLHLLGMDHAEPEEEREMFGLTEKLLATFGALDQ
ncbi:MAG: rRNA maturation RNase YbeY [Nitriliruptoraceae bacterium]